MSRTPAVEWILKINVTVFILWTVFYYFGFTFMEENFLVSWTYLMEGRIWTMITSVFSHNLLFHLLINMFVFYGFGQALEYKLGTRKFLKLYLLSGISGSFFHSAVSAYLIHQPELMALGASGAIAGILVFFALSFPKQKIYLMGLIGIPALWAVLIFVGIDIWGVLSQVDGGGLGIGHGAHLGGALLGFIYFFYTYSCSLIRH